MGQPVRLNQLQACDSKKFLPLDENGAELVTLAFYFGFFFPDGYRATTRRRVLAATEDYWRLCGKNLSRMITPVKCAWQAVPRDYDMRQWEQQLAQEVFKKHGPRTKKNASASQSDPAEEWRETFREKDWVWSMIFHSGRVNHEAAQFQILGLGNSTETQGYSYLYFNAPLPWFYKYPDPSPLVLYQRWAEMLQARHGTAGLGLIPAEDTPIRAKTSGIASAFSCMCPGAELCDPLWQQGLAIGGTLSPNWLSMIDDGYLEQLGGETALRASLANSPGGEHIGLHKYDGGIILSAGEKPLLYEGDNAEQPPLLYRSVAQALRPIRSPIYWGFWGCGKEESQQWLARFD